MRWLSWGMTLLSVVILAIVMWRLDWRELWHAISVLLWSKLLLLLFLRLAYWLLRTLNWQLVLDTCQCPRSFRQLFSIRMASNTINYLMPSASIGGEAFRVMALSGCERKRVLASVLIDKCVEVVATCNLAFVALIMVFFPLPLRTAKHLPMLLLSFLMFGASWWLILAQKRGLLTPLLNLLHTLRICRSWVERKRAAAVETDSIIREFYTEHRRLFWGVFMLYVLQLIVWTVELYLIFYFAGAPHVSAAQCFLLLNMGAVVVLIPTTPGSLGVFELSNISLFALMGIPMSYGVASLVVRRVIGYLFAGVGIWPLVHMGIRFGRKKRSAATNPAPQENELVLP